jgi:DNA polymerase III epsilon subunit-like protein
MPRAPGPGLLSRLMEHLGRSNVDAGPDDRWVNRPLHATRFVVLDLETTGLDHRRDAIVQIAMVGIENLKIDAEPLLYTLVAPHRPIPAAATQVHGIADSDVRDAPPFESLLPHIVDAWRNAVVIGHHVRFDLAILSAQARRHGHAMALPSHLDTWAMASACDRRLMHTDITDIARRFGVDPGAFRRHDAMGDATLAAELFVRLAERLIATGHATVGQAAALCDRVRLPA